MILGLFSNVEGKNHIFPNHPSYNGADRHIYLTFCDFVKIGLCPLWTHCAKGHIAKVCKSKKTQNIVIDDDGDSKAETDALTFKLFNIEKSNMVANLSHTGINEFG